MHVYVSMFMHTRVKYLHTSLDTEPDTALKGFFFFFFGSSFSLQGRSKLLSLLS